ncbi:unnamed protein product [Brassicogethes aeneus]|uniref:TNFR-Cys domain-containing protein n=1 Tax=Brassicogethes aeneus TaxID=1431903 RepID=A0A9P0BCB8_BRAAE|nr:unnamed protein product [Brassicogethes aeneus]
MLSKMVMVSVITLVLVSCLTPIANSLLCPKPNHYLNSRLQKCLECTECPKGQLVIAPCDVHRDTICGPVEEFLRSVDENRHRHKHKHHHRQHAGPHKLDPALVNNNVPMDVQMAALDADAPFTSAETLIWDWQAVVLTLAVFACIIFFVAITLYSLHQARQWKRLKDTFEADVEELSAKLSLMAASGSSSEKEPGMMMDEENEDDFSAACSPEDDYKNRCVYLEQLLTVRKDQKLDKKTARQGNVYIEESI